MLQSFAAIVLKAVGWKTASTICLPQKCVLIGAPHTSNWDFPLTLLALSRMGVRFNWVAKHTLFREPLGTIFRFIGGIPVDRSSGTAFLVKVIDLFTQRDNLVLAIAPEGTRSKGRYWKSGFYMIAKKSSVPIALGYIDYRNKVVGIGKLFHPTGDLNKDFELIRDFYQDKEGRFPHKQGEIKLKPSRRKRGL